MDGNQVEELIRRIELHFPVKLRNDSMAIVAGLRNENMQLRTKLFEFELEARRANEIIDEISQ